MSTLNEKIKKLNYTNTLLSKLPLDKIDEFNNYIKESIIKEDAKKILDEYEYSDNTETINIIHLYPKELCGEEGFNYCKFFEIIGFNSDLMSKRYLGLHDGIDSLSTKIKKIRVFADGSIFIMFDDFVDCKYFNFQCVTLD